MKKKNIKKNATKIGLLFLSTGTQYLEETCGKGLDVFKKRITKLKEFEIDLHMTIHQPSCEKLASLRLWIIKPYVGSTGHPDSNIFKLVEEWLNLEDAEKFAAQHGTFIAQEGAGGDFAKNGTSVYRVM